jgi:hypothetical protein
MVIASTSSAPGITGGLGTGMSKNRHPAPTMKLTATPIMSFTSYYSRGFEEAGYRFIHHCALDEP